MKSITILEKTYGSYKVVALKTFRQTVSKELEGLEVELLKIATRASGWITVELEGEDEEAAYNLLRHNYGKTCSLGELELNQIRKGKLFQTGKYGFGLFLDIGIESVKEIDAFLPLHTLRNQLANDQKVPLRKLIEVFGFLDNLTLTIQIQSIDRLRKNVEVSFSEGQVQVFQEWVKSKLERLFVNGVTRHKLKKIILKSRHFQDVIAIERLGFLEEMIICKRGTNAPGILSEIGPLLPESQIQLFIPNKVKDYLV